MTYVAKNAVRMFPMKPPTPWTAKISRGIIAAEEILELRRVVASNTTAHTENNSSPGRDISRTRGDADKTSDNTGAEANG